MGDSVTLAGALDGLAGGVAGALAALAGTYLTLKRASGDVEASRQHEREFAAVQRLEEHAEAAILESIALRRVLHSDPARSDEAFDRWTQHYYIFKQRLAPRFPGASKLLKELVDGVAEPTRVFGADGNTSTARLKVLQGYISAVGRWLDNHATFEIAHTDALQVVNSAGRPRQLLPLGEPTPAHEGSPTAPQI